jgi:hypothetical protein
MLKTQLWSKIYQIEPHWREVEDILTGDFFGVLDYLPRVPFLREFISRAAELNIMTSDRPELHGVDWDACKMQFWPMINGEDESAEPDVIIISNRWIIVIEVKLRSGLGNKQPWREYVVGQIVAKEHGITPSAVYYMLLTVDKSDITETFECVANSGYKELQSKTFYVQWYQIVALIEEWLHKGKNRINVVSEQVRMLSDLLEAMRKRRNIAFSGFSFYHQKQTKVFGSNYFCPPRFNGFLFKISHKCNNEGSGWRPSIFEGFGRSLLHVDLIGVPIFVNEPFSGFVVNVPTVKHSHNAIFTSRYFNGFLNTAFE